MDGDCSVEEKLAVRVGSLSIRRSDVTGSTGWCIYDDPMIGGCNKNGMGF